MTRPLYGLIYQQGHSKTLKTPTSVLTESGANGKRKAFGYKAEKEYRRMLSREDELSVDLYTDYKMVLYREEVMRR